MGIILSIFVAAGSGGVFAGLFGLLTARASNKTALKQEAIRAAASVTSDDRKTDIEQQRVDGEALERARVITDNVVTMLRKQLESYADDLEVARAEAARLRLEAEAKEEQAVQREQLRAQLEQKVDEVLRRDKVLATHLANLVGILRSTDEADHILLRLRDAQAAFELETRA